MTRGDASDMTRRHHDDDQLGLWPTQGSEGTSTVKRQPQRAAAPVPAPTPVGGPGRASGPRIPKVLNERNLWDIDDVAEYLGVPKCSIYKWRQKNYGPPAIKVGKHLRWHPASVIAWVKQHEQPAS